LEVYLAARIVRLKRRGGSAATFNSLFVTDARGTNLATVFADPSEKSQSPVGRNFSFRSYFNGEREDDPEKKPHPPTAHTHLSASFPSTSTGRWKVGISTPIWPETGEDESEEAHAKVKPIGVLVLTINLGDFDLLGANEPEGEHSRLAVLVDGRSGNQGKLLQHPVLKALELRYQENEKIPQIDARQLAALQETGLIDYQDPFSSLPEGKDFAGNWVAAIKKVRLPSDSHSNGSDRASDLWVLVQERTSFVEAPVTQLGTRLQREGYVELASIISVVLLMWYFVIRIGRANLTKGSQHESEKSLQYSDLKSTVDH
jgi:hypothetical protein